MESNSKWRGTYLALKLPVPSLAALLESFFYASSIDQAIKGHWQGAHDNCEYLRDVHLILALPTCHDSVLL